MFETLNKFADHAVPALLDGLHELGASRVLMQGATMFASVADIGARNAAAVRRLLSGRRVPVAVEDVGGSKGRTIRIDVAPGDVSVREAGGVERELVTA